MRFTTVLRALRRSAGALVLAAVPSCNDAPAAIPMGPSIFLTPPSASIAVGDSAIFSATIAFSGPPAYRWTSSNETVATVSAAGVVRGRAAGRSVITVAPGALPDVRASATVEVRAP
jgi:uncharacterized protein YjdB